VAPTADDSTAVFGLKPVLLDQRRTRCAQAVLTQGAVVVVDGSHIAGGFVGDGEHVVAEEEAVVDLAVPRLGGESVLEDRDSA
jgi:hypothetical protein